MMNEKVLATLNEQISREAYSSHLYLSMASWAETKGFAGVSNWLYLQAEEEKMHMLKFIRYINERGGVAKIPAISEPPSSFGDVLELFKKVYEHEQYITESINQLVGICMDERDFTTHNWLQWFVTEQIEEEASVCGILDKLRMLDGSNMYLFDRDLMASRPAPNAQA
jgi:ferritin